MSWTIALGQLLERRKQAFNYMFAGFMFSVGAVQFFNGVIVADKIAEYPYFAFLHVFFLVLTGPTFYFCFKTVIGSSYNLKWFDIFHGMPALIVFLMLIPLFSLESGMKKEIIMSPPALIHENPYMSFYTGIVGMVVLIVLGYMFYFLRECSSMFNISFIREKKVSPFFIIIMFIIYPIGFVFFICVVAANFVNYPEGFFTEVIQYLTVLSFFLTLMIYAMSRRDSNYFLVLRSQAEKNRYAKSKIKNLDLSLILTRIKSLMDDEKIFSDEDLTLNSFSGELEIEPYQLSQIINENFNKNFNAFVNEYRIQEAKNMLIDDENRTIASISYAVGFNSPATFYEWFCKIAGISPAKYRKKMKQHE